MKDLVKELRELCGEATPGPWKTLYYARSPESRDVKTQDAKTLICQDATVEDGKYIARVSPDVVVLLLDAIVEADKMRVFFGDMGECDDFDAARTRLIEP